MRMEMMCCESTLIDEIKIKKVKRLHIAQTYRLALESSDNKERRIDWAKVNKAIMDRWSFSGLKYIKDMAWSGKCFKDTPTDPTKPWGGDMSEDKLKPFDVVMMKPNTCVGYGNAQCIKDVCEELSEISLFGHNQCYKTWDVEKVIDTRPPQPIGEEEIKELFNALPNYDDDIPDEMWNMLKEAVKDDDRDFVTRMMKISVKKTHEECAQALAARLPKPIEGVVEEDTEIIATETLYHIEKMYPSVWHIMSGSCRRSVKNTIIQEVKSWLRTYINQGK